MADDYDMLDEPAMLGLSFPAQGRSSPSRRRYVYRPARDSLTSRFGNAGRPGSRRHHRLSQRLQLGEFGLPRGSPNSGRTLPAGAIDAMYGDKKTRTEAERHRKLPKRPIPGPFWRIIMGDAQGEGRGWCGNALDSFVSSGISDFLGSSSDFDSDEEQDESVLRSKKSFRATGFSGSRWDLWSQFLDVTEEEQEQLIAELLRCRGPRVGRSRKTEFDPDNNNSSPAVSADGASELDPLVVMSDRLRCAQQRRAVLAQLHPGSSGSSDWLRELDVALWNLASERTGRHEIVLNHAFHRYLAHGLCRLYGLQSSSFQRGPDHVFHANCSQHAPFAPWCALSQRILLEVESSSSEDDASASDESTPEQC